MGFISSDSIHAYPVASRKEGFPYSRLTTEYNLTQCGRTISSKSGFVINTEENVNNNTLIRFILKGYYFEATVNNIKNAADPQDSSGTIYAHIYLKSPDAITYKTEIEPQDGGQSTDNTDGTDDIFVGISFTTDYRPPFNNLAGSHYYIPLFDFSGNSNTIQDEYKARFSQNDISLSWTTLP